MELRRTSRRAERVDALLRGVRPAETVEDRQIAAVASALDRWPAPTLRPEFRAALRARLVAGPALGPVLATAAETAVETKAEAGGLTAAGSPRRGRATRLTRPALVGALASSVAVIGITAGARDALPGEPLYSVKRQVEQIQVTLAGSETARARAHLDIARTRLGEMQSLVGTGGSGATAEVPGLLDDWEREARSGSTVLVQRAQAGDADALVTMAEFTADQSKGLTVLVEELPEGDAQVTAEQALSYLEDVGATLDTFTAAPDSGSGSPTNLPAGSPSATGTAGATPSPTESSSPGASPTTTATGAGTGSATTAPTDGPATPSASSTGSAAPASAGARPTSAPVASSPPAPQVPGVPVATVTPTPGPHSGAGGGIQGDGQLSVQGLDGADGAATAPN